MTHHETLDEAIDRVAASMTMVSADATLPSRVRARMTKDERSNAVWGFLVAGSLAAAVLAIVVTDQRETTITPRKDAPTATLVNALPALPSSRVSEPSTESLGVRIRPDSTVAIRGAAPEPLIPALALPDALSLEDLEMQSLSIAPVEVDLLEVATLAVADIDGSLDPKE